MQTVFISSIQSGFEDVRAAARAGVESFGWRAMMAETIGAAPASPQRALLDRVADSDALLLLVGPRYVTALTAASGVAVLGTRWPARPTLRPTGEATAPALGVADVPQRERV